MKRTILCVLAVGTFLLQGCSGSMVDISSNEQYKPLIGHTFRLQKDCCVYVYKGEKSKWPFVRINSSINGATILGTLTNGTEFRLDSIYQQKVISSDTSMRYFFVISLQNSEQKRWPNLNAIELTDYFQCWPKLPMFLPEYTEMVATNSVAR